LGWVVKTFVFAALFLGGGTAAGFFGGALSNLWAAESQVSTATSAASAAATEVREVHHHYVPKTPASNRQASDEAEPVIEVGAAELPPDDPQYRAEATERSRKRYAEFEQKILDEHVDPEWASSTQRTLETDFSRFGERANFDVLEVECKTSGCLATLEWDTFREARENLMKVAAFDYSTNCETMVWVGDHPETPEEVDAPRQVRVAFNCQTSSDVDR
jgi:hypothetical protein